MLDKAQKEVITQKWSILLKFFGDAYKSGVIHDVNDSIVINDAIQTTEAALKMLIEKECDCEKKK